jgi:hypothetical protein
MSMHASADALPPTHSTNTTLIAYLCTYHGYGVRRIEASPAGNASSCSTAPSTPP